jgi:hypothetical protein
MLPGCGEVREARDVDGGVISMLVGRWGAAPVGQGDASYDTCALKVPQPGCEGLCSYDVQRGGEGAALRHPAEDAKLP